MQRDELSDTVRDMSMSFCYSLGGDERALKNFGAMTEEEKRRVLQAARGATTKEEVRALVRDVAELES